MGRLEKLEQILERQAAPESTIVFAVLVDWRGEETFCCLEDRVFLCCFDRPGVEQYCSKHLLTPFVVFDPKRCSHQAMCDWVNLSYREGQEQPPIETVLPVDATEGFDLSETVPGQFLEQWKEWKEEHNEPAL